MNSSETVTLDQLLSRCKTGDQDARAWLFTLLAEERQYGLILFAMARKLLTSGHQARRLMDTQDVVQSALGTGLDKFADFKGDTIRAFFSWMRAILRTEVHRVIRKKDQHVHLERLRPDEIEGDSPEHLTASTSASQKEVSQRLHATIAELSGLDRRILELQLSGLNATQIARATGQSPAAVRKRRSRAYHKLRLSSGLS